jgi:hypothetical protein
MSIWTKLRDKFVRPVLGLAADRIVPGLGSVITTKRSGRKLAPYLPSAPMTRPVTLPAGRATGARGMVRTSTGGWSDIGGEWRPDSQVPTLPTAGGRLILGGSSVVGGAAAALMRQAQVYCRRYPLWCAQISGGVTGVAAMIGMGQLPRIKTSRRRRGISATDLKHFRRVAGFLSKWGPVASKLPCKPRKGRSC